MYIPACTVFAQQPAGDDVDAQAERFKKGIEERREKFEEKEIKPLDIEIEEEAKPAAPEGPSFILKDIKITGMTVFKPEDFLPIYEPYLNKEITFKGLQVIAEKIKARYKAGGYLTTVVFIPEQDITDGKVKIRAVEGKMGNLKIEGNKRFSTPLITKYFHTKSNEVLNIIKLKRDILRLNQNPDLEIKTIIAKGEKPQTTDIILKVKERLPYHLGTGVDNQGTRLTGKYRSSFSFRSTNLTGNNDYLYTNSLVSADTSGESLMYILPLDTYGTRLGIDFTYFTSKLGREYRYLDRTGNTYILTPYFSKELYLSERRQTNISAGLEMKSVEKKARGTLTTDDQLRLPYIEVDFTNIDAFFGGGQNSFIPRATFGTDHFLGAGSHNQPKASRIDTGGCFFKYEHSIRRVQKMPLGSYLILDSDFQSTSDTLPTAEQFQLGGANSIRGYPEGDYLADIGARLSVDWVFPMYLIPPKWKLTFSDTPLRRQIEPVIFADIGGGKLKKVLPGERKDKFLLGLGGGLRVHVNRNLYARLEWAKSVGDEPTGGAGPSSFHLTFQFEI